MSRFKIINLIDKLFITIAVFLIIYAWINFYIRDLWTTFILSIIFTFASVYLLYFFINKKHNKKNLSNQKLKDVAENFLAFKLAPLNQKLELINKILSVEHITILKRKSLTYIKENKKVLVIFATNIDNLTQNDLLNLLATNNSSEVECFEIICNEISPNINTKIFNNKTIKIVTKTSLYMDYFLKHNIFPDKSEINLNATKISWQDILKGVFEKKKARPYFIYGLLLIFSSIILPYQAYYIVFGSMFLLFSIICKILPKFTNC